MLLVVLLFPLPLSFYDQIKCLLLWQSVLVSVLPFLQIQALEGKGCLYSLFLKCFLNTGMLTDQLQLN